MTTHIRDVVLRVVLIITISLAGFAALQAQFRHFEAWASNALVNLFASGHSFASGSSSIGVLPLHDTPFTAVITPSCSALASVLAVSALASISTRLRPGRRLLAATAAAVLVTVGNIVRIASSTGVGVLLGRSSLVLFHDWVGGLMTFVYTLGGYTLMLFLLLPRHPPATEEGGPMAEAEAPAGVLTVV